MRSGLLSALAAMITIAAHSAGGGEAPHTSSTVLITLALALAGTAIVDRLHNTVAVIAGLGAVQLVLHGALSVVEYVTAHYHAAPEVSAPAMTGAQITAIVVIGILLARADAAVNAVGSMLAHVLPRKPYTPPSQAPLRLSVTPAAPVSVVVDVVWKRICVRRGPPVCT
ncbi:hypothetical protein [Amycolatopsis methanolica]|uniref:hypothetical protein n=1 Tax=Amycolatopsis methanolica TaxID=1814 RepID=UPI00341AD917